MRGRFLIGLSNAHRRSAGMEVGDEVEVTLRLDTSAHVLIEPEDLARALDANARARAAYDRLSFSRRREHVLCLERAKRPETRARRIDMAIAALSETESPLDGDSKTELSSDD